MRVVIATGLYPPEIGGPALYAAGVAQALEKKGYQSAVVTFGNLRNYPSGLRHLMYVARLYRASRGASAIFAFDTFSTGVPAALIARIRRIPLVIRIGGDFLWERYLERTNDLVPLPDFYTSHRALSLKERVSFRLVRWMLREAYLAFNSEWLLEIWREPYNIDVQRTRIVENVIGKRITPLPSDNTLLLYGRTLALKNHERFTRAFARTKEHGSSMTLEEGIVPHAELINRMRSAYAIAVTSVPSRIRPARARQ